MKFWVAVSALVLMGTAMSCDVPALAEGGLESDIDVERLEIADIGIAIGRLSVMNEKTQEIWQKLRNDEHRDEYSDAAAKNYALRRTVWELNALREDLCHDRFMVEKSCGPPYVPKWAYESAKVIPSAAELQERQQDLEEKVVWLWDAACERLGKIITTSDIMYYCSIE
jgi:hypothetical protein